MLLPQLAALFCSAPDVISIFLARRHLCGRLSVKKQGVNAASGAQGLRAL